MAQPNENPAARGALAGLNDAFPGGNCSPQNTKSQPLAQDNSRNYQDVREAKLELQREAIFENLGAVRLFVETAQLLIEARDDAGMTHAVKMGAHHYRAAVQTTNELAALMREGGP
jgi:hypothetical protein